jgi:bifunctional non-homologous end joining protein LigD
MAERLKRHRVILDGELVAIGADGKPDLFALNQRMFGPTPERGRSRRAVVQRRVQVCLMLFDLLYLDGDNLVARPIEDRKRLLADLELTGDAWRTVSYSVGNVAALLIASREQRLEGIVAKRIGSKYTPGERTPDWMKFKNYDSRELIIGGWIEHRDGTFGILVGDREGERLVFMGVVDFGTALELIAVLKTIETKATPFARGSLPRRARHCQPRLGAIPCRVGCTAGRGIAGCAGGIGRR